jgi:anti-sigma factor RsiW
MDLKPRMGRVVSGMMRLFGRRSCADVVAALHDYFEGSIDPELARIIERHLEGCVSCEAFARTYREVVKLTGELSDDDVPASVRRRVRKALRERARQNPPGRE